MMTQRVGQLVEGDVFTGNDGETWMTVKDTTIVLPQGGGATIVLVVSISGQRWWGRVNEEVIVNV